VTYFFNRDLEEDWCLIYVICVC